MTSLSGGDSTGGCQSSQGVVTLGLPGLAVTLHQVGYSSMGTTEGSCDKGMHSSRLYHIHRSLCCSGVSHGIPVVTFCHCGCLNCFYTLAACVVAAAVLEAHAFYFFTYSPKTCHHFLQTLLLHLGCVFTLIKFLNMVLNFSEILNFSGKLYFGLQYIYIFISSNYLTIEYFKIDWSKPTSNHK